MEPIIQEIELSRAELQREAGEMLEVAKTLPVTSRETMLVATNYLKHILSAKARINEKFNPIIKRAHETHKMTIALRGEILAPFLLAEDTLKPKINSFLLEEERKRKAAEEAMRETLSGLDIPIPDLPKQAPPEGVYLRRNLKINITDMMALCTAIAKGTVPVLAVYADESYIRKVAERVGPENLNYPGVEAHYEKGLVVRE